MKTITISTEQIWHDFKNRLEQFILARVKNKTEAQDILQEVFIKIHLHLPALKNEHSLVSWIYQITRNVIQDHYRKQRFFVDIDKIELPDAGNAVNTKFGNCMLPFINRLPEKYREAIVFADLRGLNQVQLAEKLGISYSGVKSRVQRARRLLHSYFTECCDISTDKYGAIISHEPKGSCLCSA